MVLIRQKPTTTSFAGVVEAAATKLIAAHGQTLRRQAARYSLCADDAEDACQRAFEILMTKAPSTSDAELLLWMQIVVKHEALAIRRRAERMAGVAVSGQEPTSFPPPEEFNERSQLKAHAGEALMKLKRQEITCLVLKAKGFNYNEISRLTGYSWTKVNRSISEGRGRFFKTYESIASGHECEKVRNGLGLYFAEKLADSERAAIKFHLKGCSPCRSVLVSAGSVLELNSGSRPDGNQRLRQRPKPLPDNSGVRKEV